MTTLVTGAFGCIGAWVCKRLLGRKTLDEVAALKKPRRLDARELEPAK